MLPASSLLPSPLQHSDEEYGADVAEEEGIGRHIHSGGPFLIKVAPAMRVEDLRLVIRVRKGGISLLQLHWRASHDLTSVMG